MTTARSPLPARMAAARAYNHFNTAAFTIGAKATNTINVGVVLLEARGRAPTGICHAKVFLSANSDGSTLTPTVPTSTVAIGTNGLILNVLTTNKVLAVLANAAGLFDLNLIQTAGGTVYYLVVVAPSGLLIVSPAITF